MQQPVLQARGLSMRYRRGAWALRDVDLSLAPGGVVGLVGPNGAGKSTLLRLAVGFDRPTGGELSVLGMDPWREREAVLRRVAYLPQSLALYKRLSVADHFDYVAHYRGRGFDRALATTRLAELQVPLGALVGTLSGGQAAQVGLAVALGLRAELLILDEPLASLDPLARRGFIEVLTDGLARTGATAILSSHIVSDIERACSRLVVLGLGEVQLDAGLDEALASHFVWDGPADAGARLVARLSGQECLYAGAADGRPAGARTAGLEDVVLGYLTAGQAQRQ